MTIIIWRKGSRYDGGCHRPSEESSPSSEDSDGCSSSSLSSSKDDRSLVWTELTVMSLSPSRSESSREYSRKTHSTYLGSPLLAKTSNNIEAFIHFIHFCQQQPTINRRLSKVGTKSQQLTFFYSFFGFLLGLIFRF